jgi:hypothetical protein
MKKGTQLASCARAHALSRARMRCLIRLNARRAGRACGLARREPRLSHGAAESWPSARPICASSAEAAAATWLRVGEVRSARSYSTLPERSSVACACARSPSLDGFRRRQRIANAWASESQGDSQSAQPLPGCPAHPLTHRHRPSASASALRIADRRPGRLRECR